MSVRVAVCVAAIVAACLAEWPAAVGGGGGGGGGGPRSNPNRYGKPLQQNRYGNPPAWLQKPWLPSSSSYGGNIMRHYPVSIDRYKTAVAAARPLKNAFSDEYGGYDAAAANPRYYDPRPSSSYDRMDYAVVRYPSYGAGGYYSPSAYDVDDSDDSDDSDVDLMYDDAAAVPRPYGYPAAPPAINRYRPSVPAAQPSSRYYVPTDNMHKFRKVFRSNPVSPSNAFKSTKERQLYDFWESLISGDLDGMGQRSNDRAGNDVADGPQAPRRPEWLPQQQQQPQQPAPTESGTVTSATVKLYQHLPSIFQQLQQKQRQQQQQQQQQRQQSSPPDERTPSSMPRGNLYKQWANGSPLIKRSGSATGAIPPNDDSDDVRQLERLKLAGRRADATTEQAREAAATARPAAPTADGGQREYVLPRPAGEKSGFESLLEVIAEGGIRENAAATYEKSRQESKMNKNKRSLIVSDETSLAAQLGALRKN